MNPWGNSKLGPKDLTDYLDFAEVERFQVPSQICDFQSQILAAMDNYYKLSAALKEDSDLSKVGEFIQPSKLEAKLQQLREISNLFNLINEKHEVFIQKAKESRPGNQIFIKQEYHRDFFKVLSMIKDTDLLDIAAHTGEIHTRTKQDLANCLSASLSQESDLIVESIKTSNQNLELIRNKYLKSE